MRSPDLHHHNFMPLLPAICIPPVPWIPRLKSDLEAVYEDSSAHIHLKWARSYQLHRPLLLLLESDINSLNHIQRVHSLSLLFFSVLLLLQEELSHSAFIEEVAKVLEVFLGVQSLLAGGCFDLSGVEGSGWRKLRQPLLLSRLHHFEIRGWACGLYLLHNRSYYH